MQFASFSGLWFAFAIPFIILLYMLKRQYIDTDISSHMLWRRVLREQEANRPWQRLRRQLLLLLQLLAAALFVIAIMQPFIRGQQTAKAHIFFVIDASASMNTVTKQGKTRLEQAKQDMLSYLHDEAAHRTYSLLVIKDQPELLLQQESDASAFRAALEKVTPFYGKSNVQESLSLASALTREEPDGEVRIYSDSQWAEQPEELAFSVPVQVAGLHDGAEDEPVNVSIAQFGVKSGEEDFRAVAVLKNWGNINSAIEYKLYGDSEVIRTGTLPLNAGEQQSVFFEKLASAERYKLEIVSTDALTADNTAYAFPEGTGRTQIAYIGEGNLFLQKALLLAKSDVLHIQKSDDGTYPPPASSPDIIIVDGIDESALKAEKWKSLLAVKPVWRFASSAQADTALSSDKAFAIADHPALRYIRLQEVNIAQAHNRAALPWEKVLVSSSGIPLILAGSEEGAARISFTFPLEQSDLALRPEFPILVQNVIAWLSQHQGGHLGRIIAGEQIDVNLHPQAVKALWTKEMEGAAEEQAELHNLVARQTAPSLPGLYALKEYDESGQMLQMRFLEVAMDARESNVNGKTESKLNYIPSTSGGLTLKEGEDGIGSASFVPWIIITLLLLLVSEWEVYRRGYSV